MLLARVYLLICIFFDRGNSVDQYSLNSFANWSSSESNMEKLLASVNPPPPQNCVQPVIHRSLLYSGSKFRGHQKSKGNCYNVEVTLQVGYQIMINAVVMYLYSLQLSYSILFI